MVFRIPQQGTGNAAIIGGGLSAALLLLALLRRGGPSNITIYEPEAEIGPGLAYGAAAPWHLLNVIATRASLYQTDPDHWWRWARENGPALGWPETAGATSTDYLPRRLFGHYVVHELEQVRRNPDAARLAHRRNAAVHVAARDGRFVVTDAAGQSADYDTVVLATGATPGPHFDLPGLAELRQGWNWIDDPWDLQVLAKIPQDEAVLIVGSALTMADTVLTLARLGHRGPIHVLSRHGVVPEARREQVVRFAGISAADGALPLSHMLLRLRQAVRANGIENWQAVFEGLRNSTNDLWISLPHEAQRRFMRHLRGLWDAHRFRMPPATAEILDRLRQSAQLRFHKGSLQRFATQPDGSIDVLYRPRGQTAGRSLSVAAVMDCTGPRRPAIDWAGQLLGRLLSDGLLLQSPAGMGIHATPEGAVLDGGGAVRPGLHVIGPLLRGPLLESTAISEIRGQADALAAWLAVSAAG